MSIKFEKVKLWRIFSELKRQGRHRSKKKPASGRSTN
jgi:hypothetical protein